MTEIKPRLWAIRKEMKKKYKTEACKQKLELNQPVFLLEWAFYKPVTMLE